MGILKFLKKFIIDTSVCFTVITPIYAALQMIVDTGENETAMKASWLLYLFLFSLLTAISVAIYRIKSINKALRVFLQCSILMFSAYVCFFTKMTPYQIIIGVTLVCILYFICFGVFSIFKWRYNKLVKKEEIYEAKYKKKK